MNNKFTEKEIQEYTDKIFLAIFKEEGISDKELEKMICQSYNTEDIKYNNISELPIKYKEEAIIDCCEAAGLKFENFQDILLHFYEQYFQ